MEIEVPEFNDVLREGVLEAVGWIEVNGVPVGGLLAKFIGLFWTGPDKSHAQWLGLKKYAEELVRDEIDKERIEGLNKDIEGLLDIATAYKNTSMRSKQKGQHLTSLLNSLRLQHAKYWDERNPEKMYPLYTTFGTLWIGALFDQAFKYNDVYGEADPDAEMHLQEFRDNVLKYVAGAQTVYDRLYASRFGKLRLVEWQSRSGLYYNSTWTFTDHYDGYTKTKTESGDGAGFHGPRARAEMEREFHDRVFNINSDYVKGLQETLAVAQLWQYLEPNGIRPLKYMLLDDEGPWGGDRDIAQDFEDRPPIGSRITHIALRTDGQFIEGLQLTYDGKPGAWHGNTIRGELRELALEADETVVEVSGRSTSLIDHIAFKTSKGRVIEGGSSHGTPFSATGRKGWKLTSLYAIGGWTDGNRLTGLKLHWKHLGEFPTYSPSYKRTPPLPTGTNLHFKAPNGKFVSNLVEEYSGKAAANEYFPKLGDAAVALQLILPSNAGTLADHDIVQIKTTEPAASWFNLLSRFTTVQTYYYRSGFGNTQAWEVIKMIPSDGPVLTGEKIYLRNVEGCNYLSVDEGGYITSVADPCAWEMAVP